MSLKVSLAAALALASLSAAAPASAAVFDFMAEANKLEKGYQPYTLTRDGITVTGLFNAGGSAGLSLICNRCGPK